MILITLLLTACSSAEDQTTECADNAECEPIIGIAREVNCMPFESGSFCAVCNDDKNCEPTEFCETDTNSARFGTCVARTDVPECSTLSETECVEERACGPAISYELEGGCLVEKISGCLPAQNCNNNIGYAVGPQGECRQFPNLCFPEGWTQTNEPCNPLLREAKVCTP